MKGKNFYIDQLMKCESRDNPKFGYTVFYKNMYWKKNLFNKLGWRLLSLSLAIIQQTRLDILISPHKH